jgi:hypothetical protein
MGQIKTDVTRAPAQTEARKQPIQRLSGSTVRQKLIDSRTIGVGELAFEVLALDHEARSALNQALLSGRDRLDAPIVADVQADNVPDPPAIDGTTIDARQQTMLVRDAGPAVKLRTI